MWNKKTMAALLAAVMVVGSAIGGTVAWLVAKTDSVVNTFTYGDINIELEETPTNPENPDPTKNEYKMVPGTPITKDPKVTVLKDNEACWLFVKLEKNGGASINDAEGNLVASYGFDDYLEYAMADGWTHLVDAENNVVEGVYYRSVDADTDATGVTYDVIKDNTVNVKGTVTKEMLNALNADPAKATFPTLTVTAYAVQKANVADAITAWGYVQNPTGVNP